MLLLIVNSVRVSAVIMTFAVNGDRNTSAVIRVKNNMQSVGQTGLSIILVSTIIEWKNLNSSILFFVSILNALGILRMIFQCNQWKN